MWLHIADCSVILDNAFFYPPRNDIGIDARRVGVQRPDQVESSLWAGRFQRTSGLYILNDPLVPQYSAHKQKAWVRRQGSDREAFGVDPGTIDDPAREVRVEKSLVLEELSVVRVLEEQPIGEP
ncbi:hypothetical protein D3C86_1592680 [compost metagenome]